LRQNRRRRTAPNVDFVASDRCSRTGNAGIVHEDIDAPELAFRFGKGGFHGLPVGLMAADCQDVGLARKRFCSLAHLLQVGIPDRHSSPRFDEALYDREPDTLRTARHHGDASGKIMIDAFAHFRLPFLVGRDPWHQGRIWA
jgi:hypothetical protein